MPFLWKIDRISVVGHGHHTTKISSKNFGPRWVSSSPEFAAATAALLSVCWAAAAVAAALVSAASTTTTPATILLVPLYAAMLVRIRCCRVLRPVHLAAAVTAGGGTVSLSLTLAPSFKNWRQLRRPHALNGAAAAAVVVAPCTARVVAPSQPSGLNVLRKNPRRLDSLLFEASQRSRS